MKAVVFKGPYDLAVEEVPDPRIEAANDAIIRVTTANICGSDLHPYEGRAPLEAGMVLGHENMGIVEEVGPGVNRDMGEPRLDERPHRLDVAGDIRSARQGLRDVVGADELRRGRESGRTGQLGVDLPATGEPAEQLMRTSGWPPRRRDPS